MAGKYMRKPEDQHFIKTFKISNFRVFNPRFKQCLTGTERGLFDYILVNKLTYVGVTRPYGGNTIRIDKQYKEKVLKEFKVSAKTYEQMITKLIQDGVFNRISNSFFQVNPYAFAKGENVNCLRELGIYKDSTLNFKDAKYICPTIPPEDPWAESEDEDENEVATDNVADTTPTMPPITGRNATLNNCFKK